MPHRPWSLLPQPPSPGIAPAPGPCYSTLLHLNSLPCHAAVFPADDAKDDSTLKQLCVGLSLCFIVDYIKWTCSKFQKDKPVFQGRGHISSEISSPVQKEESAVSTRHLNNEPSLCIPVIGATGELARTKVSPALFALNYSGFLPRNVGIFGYSGMKLMDQGLRSVIEAGLTCRVITGTIRKCDYAAITTFKAISHSLVETGCAHIADLPVKDVNEYQVTSEEARALGKKFYEAFWLVGGNDLAMYNAACS